MKRIACVVGARPQFIKLAPLSRQIRKRKGLKEIIIHTGQHYDRNMSSIFFKQLEIPKPNLNLGVGSGDQGAQTGEMLQRLEKAFKKIRPDKVVVFGDTNTTLAGALAAAKLHIPVSHVEAGLRSFNRAMPEELNRILTDHLSEKLFAPTKTAVKNLKTEGIPVKKVKWVGDIMFDAALYFLTKAKRQSQALKKFHLKPKKYVLATLHRAENTNNRQRLKALMDGLSSFSQKLPVLLPIHPRTKRILKKMKLKKAPGLQICDPVGYLDMLLLTKNARLVATDSGGLQKEAYFYQVPAAVLRDETEWVELVHMGWNKIVSPTSARAVEQGLGRVLRINPKKKRKVPLFGQGNAAKKIVASLLSA